MPEVVNARPGAIASAPQTDLARQAPENTVHIRLQQSTASLRDKEIRAAARSEMTVAPFRVAAEHFTGRRMQGQKARLSELSLSNRQHTLLEINITALQAHRLGEAHTRYHNKPEQMVIGPTAQSVSWGQGERRRQQRVDLAIIIDIGLRPIPFWKDPVGRYLRLRIDARDMSRETTNVGQSVSRRRMCTVWQSHPCQGEFYRNGRGLARLHEGNKIAESPRLNLVLVSQPLAHAQISLKFKSQTGHRAPPGHGRLNVRRASISTLA